MKLNVIKKRNLDGLDYAINNIKDINYLVMNTQTMNEISHGNTDAISYQANSGYYTLYRKIPIALCERLPDGEVEVVKVVNDEIK